ncbi:hypothetical protein FCN77_11080 [Arthrobacter sp. 24S4-2]|nr:hypothetical protein FCN77_11080 [Arthrobacter sp. 24S4-2]
MRSSDYEREPCGGRGSVRAHEGIHDVPQGRGDWGTPITRQLRTVGRRRRDAELKLEQHLQEARHKNKPHDGPAEPIPSG